LVAGRKIKGCASVNGLDWPMRMSSKSEFRIQNERHGIDRRKREVAAREFQNSDRKPQKPYAYPSAELCLRGKDRSL
jgi:hypothetical protein